MCHAMARDAKLSSCSVQTFDFHLAFSLRGKNCINRNKQTQITQKEGPESIAIHHIS